MPRVAGRRVVLGIGNPDRGDDAAGREVVQRLRGALPQDVLLAEETGEVVRILARIEGAEAAYLIDACASGAPPGSVSRFDVAEARLPQHASAASTHGLGLAEAIELARALGQLPTRCIVYAIEGARFEPGASLSPAVGTAVDEVAQRLRAELV
ncbi:MAG: hydrogenase maturation protease [Hyphomicrobium sp.]|uniref:hydrogenase maturation protease n=1 Tax=Hyphomicrobium sp. TaxID=82 RepID=UPI0013212F4C|nr:hydrogenase maturation protease [Hyphomicrobium sp.]KAB2943480.1 MAG: hydrogenase maturation protease [Hyphomicrobium sp.]MBZ0210724.1 hydrogenase maturation protease [Hyphomicrobium sp.]